jgi:hypothetical protein
MSEETRRVTTGWMLSAALVALVAIALVAVVLLGEGEGEAAQPQATRTSASTQDSTAVPAPSTAAPTISASPQESPSEEAPDAGCHGGSPDSIETDPALDDVTWEPVLSSAIPSSVAAGPVDTEARSCFEHSPAGALLAASNVAVGMYLPDGAGLIERQITAGPGRDAALRDQARGGAPGNIVAYRLSACGLERCNVELVVFGQGLFGHGVMPMVWSEGDWRVDGSSLLPEPGLVQSIPAGFTQWGPAL